MSIGLPYVASCRIDGKLKHNLDLVKMNALTALVRLPDGNVVKRSFRKHGLELTYIDVTH